MLCGEPPFLEDDGKELLKSILTDSVSFEQEISPDAKDLISKLLTNDPDERLGSGERGVDEIKDHPFFSNINWTDMYMKRVRPPYVPLVKSESDICNFDFLFKSGHIEKESSANLQLKIRGLDVVQTAESGNTVFENYTFIG